MLWQVPGRKSEDTDPARCFTQMSWPRQARSSAGLFEIFSFPFGKLIAEARGALWGHPGASGQGGATRACRFPLGQQTLLEKTDKSFGGNLLHLPGAAQSSW